ncbi:hypothetical protein [Sphingobium yanoikuyae]|uniref:hypothetical protein n=1 Tax=Sphingobium yanoikuyae TaxID=13690 RepID=UPI0022DD04BD|nr:hypothetical protein [Sphingobium yanoikuyae]WBQ14828.1 hypothetical protein PAE53_12880 [Sphingobium yanoikuyae]
MASSEYFAHIVAIIDKNGLPIGDAIMAAQYEEEILEVVISAGADHGVTEEMRFVIYEEGDELFDPVNQQSLGRFEIVKGQARVVHLQDKMSKIRSSSTKRVLRNPMGFSNALVKVSSSQSEYKVVAVPFRGVKIGDKVRPV